MESDPEIIYLSLSMRKCFIETGQSFMSAIDAERMGKKVNPLSTDQMKLIIRIEELMEKALTVMRARHS